MDDRVVALLEEIRGLLQRTVSNQEQVLRSNDESMRIYRTMARRQGIAAAVGIVILVALYLTFL